MEKGKKSFIAATFTLVGTIVGAGILGLPYVFAQAGFWVGVFWLIFLGSILLYVTLCMGEVTLRTRTFHQLPGYAEKYLGKKGEILMLIICVFGFYSGMLAYLIGEGKSLSYLFTGGFEYAVYFTIGFWLLMTLVLREGRDGLRKIETLGVFFVLIIVFGIFIYFCPQITTDNLNFVDSNFFLPFGVVLFAFLGFTAVPEMRMLLKGKEKLFKRSILIGKTLPFVLYFLFTLTCVGVFGRDILEVATLSLGRIATLLGIFTMTTCYSVFSFALRDVFKYDLHREKFTWVFVSAIPITSYLLVNFFGFASFVLVLSIGGAITGGLKGIVILLMARASKSKGKRKPEYSVPINWLIIVILSLIFILGIVVEVLSIFGIALS